MKTIVFDDDPTGSQTVHDCPLLLKWDKDTILRQIDKSSLLFILGNTRSLTPEFAETRTREICKSLLLALAEKELLIKDFFIVSRGDSTLRGHGVLEPQIINEELGPFDATFHIPAFFEGGRLTLKGTHFLNGIPVHKTTFGNDKIFGYSTSFLPKWIEEKSNGKIKDSDVHLISIEKLEEAKNSKIKMDNLIQVLASFSSNHTVIVDAKSPSDLDIFCRAVNTLNGKKRFLFRSAASLINSLTNVRSYHNERKDFSSLRIKSENNGFKPGLVIVGSHVSLADQQLDVLLKEEKCMGIELPVQRISRLLNEEFPEPLIVDMEYSISKKLIDVLKQNKTPVLYTSRGELYFSSNISRMKFGVSMAEFMANISATVIDRLGYIISKGGITTNTLLTSCFNAELVILKGQIMPGLSLVCLPDSQLGSSFPIVTFPGNLGNKFSLLHAWRIMESNAK